MRKKINFATKVKVTKHYFSLMCYCELSIKFSSPTVFKKLRILCQIKHHNFATYVKSN